jgi:hypothetical protein
VGKVYIPLNVLQNVCVRECVFVCMCVFHLNIETSNIEINKNQISMSNNMGLLFLIYLKRLSLSCMALICQPHTQRKW